MSKKTYPITELSETWQGEGPFTGYPIYLIRFAGCNLECDWCDEMGKGRAQSLLTIDDIETDIHEYAGPRHILLTGGEPTLYMDDDLTSMLGRHQVRHDIPRLFIETNGTKDIPDTLQYDIVVSPKPQQRLRLKKSSSRRIWLKFIIPGGWSDVEEIIDIADSYGMPHHEVYFQPQARVRNLDKTDHGYVGMLVVKAWADTYRRLTGYHPRLSLQMHKFVNIP